MPGTPEAEETRRLERIRLLLENDLTAEEKASRVRALIGGTFEASGI